MPSLPSRKSLETLKRADLQRLCKDYGVKANLKSEALIDLLLDAQKPAMRPTRRSVSTRMSSRSGPSHINSVIIHDKDDNPQDQGLNEEQSCGHESDTQVAAGSKPITPPATRARKAKEQTRLGVGRPTAGGSGPRAITKSSSVSKNRRAKASKTMTPPQDTIPEEDQERETLIESTQDINNPPPKAAPDNVTQAHLGQPRTRASSGEETLASLATIDKHVADALRPLHEQMKSLKSELELMQSLRAEIGELKTQVAEIGTLKEKVEALTGELQDFRMQATSTTPLASEHHLSQPGTLVPLKPAAPSSPSSHRSRKELSGPGISHSTDSDSPGPQISYDSSAATSNHPGIAPVMLGKRQRDSPGSNVASMVEELDDELSEDDPGKKLVRPARKRAKVSNTPDDMTTEGESMVLVSRHSQEEVPASSIAKFTVFSGPTEYSDNNVDPPPPNNPLPDLFRPPSTGAGPSYARQTAMGTSSAHASENQQPFNFSFPPMSSTPAHDLFMPSFPYPEPPQSPSPAVINSSGFFRGGERADAFQQFGFPNPGRSSRSRLGSHVGGGFVDPAALTRRIPDGDPDEPSRTNTGNEMATSLPEPGPSSSTGMEVVVDVPLMKRTMYGTELEGDTRFGDFGVEGVGGNGAFWADGRY